MRTAGRSKPARIPGLPSPSTPPVGSTPPGTPANRPAPDAWSDDGRTFSDPQPLVTGVGVSQVKLSGNGQPTVLVAWEDKLAQIVRIGYTNKGRIEPLPGVFDGGILPAVGAGASGWIVAAQHESDAVIVSGK
jgi:hypothetical protein